ncbi:hypothetical protein AZI86_10970 [Bdellovibrio bacteriovorus]|uniref:Uncharacterized protein n=1 Tax=Bdellovibrio bacteriovorus TaxID=959 RepID=A0A150WLZ5_BDEBC|nr:oligosaccharide flippase family protein [Bdellovibrio bacteriovorus]KYG64723.1 hypothetical protein AZI86_10970 [Bdellovibrio bacteriovorus]
MKRPLKELFLHFFVYGIGSVAQSAVTFLLLPLLTNKLSTADFGVFSLIQMCGAIAATIFYFGISSALSRSYFDYELEKDRNIVFSTSFYLIVLGAILQVMCGFFFRNHLSEYLFGTAQWGDHIFWTLTGTAIAFVNQIFYNYMRFVKWSRIVSISGVLTLLLNIGISYFLLVYSSMGVMAPIMGALFSSLIIFIYLLYVCRGVLVAQINRPEIKILIMFGIPNMLASVAAMVMEWSNRFFLNKYLSVEDAGVYTVGARAASIISIILIAPFAQVWNPIMMENRTNEGKGAMFTKVTTYYMTIGVVGIIFCSLFFVEFLHAIIPKPDYYRGIQLTPILMLGVLINGLNNIVSAGLFYERKMQYLVYVYGVVAIVSTILNASLIPYFGYSAAAWAALLTYTLVPLLTYAVSKRFQAIDFEVKKVFLGVILCLCVVSFIGYLDFIPLLYRLLLKTSIFIGCVFFVWIFVFDSSEKSEVSKILRLRRIGDAHK